MTAKDDGVYIIHMLECIEKIFDYTEDGEQAFRQSTLIQDAVLRNLQTLAESSQRISTELKQQFSEIPWREVSGFRNILVHDYLGLDIDSVWSVIEQDLESMQTVLHQMRN